MCLFKHAHFTWVYLFIFVFVFCERERDYVGMFVAAVALGSSHIVRYWSKIVAWFQCGYVSYGTAQQDTMYSCTRASKKNSISKFASSYLLIRRLLVWSSASLHVKSAWATYWTPLPLFACVSLFLISRLPLYGSLCHQWMNVWMFMCIVKPFKWLFFRDDKCPIH